jgi:hypothetical protein
MTATRLDRFLLQRVILLGVLLACGACGEKDDASHPPEWGSHWERDIRANVKKWGDVEWRVANMDRTEMTPEEMEFYAEYCERSVKWKKGKISSADMEAFLNRDKKELSIQIVTPRRSFHLGESLPIAVVIHNKSDYKQAVFPFQRFLLFERGAKNADRHGRFGFRENPGLARYLYLVPPGGQVVIPLELPAHPVGSYRAEVLVTLASWEEFTDIRAFGSAKTAGKVIDFIITSPGDGEPEPGAVPR